MSGELIDFSIERQRHDEFVGREALLDRLDELLAVDGPDRWVVVTGGPGMGKSALLSAWINRREPVDSIVPHHFIRRGQYEWDDPTKLVSSLVAQLEVRYPGIREPERDERLHPAARLAAMLSRVSATVRSGHNPRLVVVIDGLDEYDPPAGATAIDPLSAFLPHALPRGVSFLCATRPRHPYLDRLAERDGEQTQLDLDESDFAIDNAATVRAIWERAAPDLRLPAQFVDEAVARAGGNLQHAATLRKQLAAMPASQRRVLDIPRGLAALLGKLWERVANDPVAVTGLGILCAARGALTLHELATVAGWTDEAQRRMFERSARELLIETRRANGAREYRLHHDSIRTHIASAVGAKALRMHHRALARKLATWPLPTDATARRYALQHALLHRVEAGAWTHAWRLASDMCFVETKCREVGAHDAVADMARAAEHCSEGNKLLSRRFSDLARALGLESHWLRVAPESTSALVWNRLRRLGWSRDEADQQLQVPTGTRFLRLRHLATKESPRLVRDLVCHAGRVKACAVTPDGRRVVSAASDRTLKVWDLETGQEVMSLQGHVRGVSACAVTPDGRRVISGAEDGTLSVWDLETGRQMECWRLHSGKVSACAVTPDGRRVVSAAADRTLKVWDLETGREVASLQGHTGWVNACAVAPDGRRVVSGSDDRTIRVWDLATGQEMAQMHHDGKVNACVVTPDGRNVVSASEDRTQRVWDLATGRELSRLQGDVHVRACAVTPDGRHVMSGSHDRALKVLNLETGREVESLVGHAAGVNACVVTPNGRRVVSGSDDGTLKVWDLETRLEAENPQGHADKVTTCVVTPDGQRVVSGSYDRTLKVWDLATGREVANLRGHTRWVNTCAVTPDGRCLVSGSDDGTLKMWDLETKLEVESLRGHTGRVNACAVTPDGRRLVSASDDGTLKVWDLETRQETESLRGHTGRVNTCAVTPDGRYVVSGSDDGALKMWDLEVGLEVKTLTGYAGRVSTCAVTPDGRRVVSASDDGTLKVWDLETGLTVASLAGHTGGISTCTVTPCGKHVVSGSDDRTLTVWDIETGECLLTHFASAAVTTVTTTTTSIIAGDISGSIWFLDRPAPNSRNRVNIDSHSEAPGLQTPNILLRSPRPATKHTILFLAANPVGALRLALDREAREIQVELERSGFRDRFELVTRWAAEPLDLLRELRKLRPTVVHFSGHGSTAAENDQWPSPHSHRDVGGLDHPDCSPRQGLFFRGPDGLPQLVSTEALKETFAAAGNSVRLVVLNACYSEAHAKALVSHAGCVVGMRESINDDAARSFAIGFYGGLGERQSITDAYKQGCAAISLHGIPDHDNPQLTVHPDIDASKLFLAVDPFESSVSHSATTPASSRLDTGPLFSPEADTASALKEGSLDHLLRHPRAETDERRAVAASRHADTDSFRSVRGRRHAHSDEVSTCVVTPDSKHVISASFKSTDSIKVWNIENTLVAELDAGHFDGVTVCTVAPDSRLLVSGGSGDPRIIVWDLDSGDACFVLNAHDAGVTSCVISPDGSRAISGSRDGCLKVWSLESGRLLRTLEGHTNKVTSCAVTSNGNYAISASLDSTIRVWNLDQGDFVAAFPVSSGARYCTTTPDEKHIISISFDNKVSVWSLANLGKITEIDCSTNEAQGRDARGVATTAENKTTAGWIGSLRRRRAQNRARRSAYASDSANGPLHAVTPDGLRVVTHHTVRAVDSGSVLTILEGQPHPVTAYAITSDGQYFIAALSHLRLKVWDLFTGRCLFTHRLNAMCLAVATRGSTIIAGDENGCVWFLEWPHK